MVPVSKASYTDIQTRSDASRMKYNKIVATLAM